MKLKIWKKYKSLGCSNLYTTITVTNKRKERIYFTDGGTRSGVGYFSTSDEALQKAIENSPSYGKLFTLYEQKEKAITAPITEKGDKNPKDDKVKDTENPLPFPNFNSFRDYLIKEHNQDMANVRTLAAATKVANELGINFVIE